jgi:hypothetical protein
MAYFHFNISVIEITSDQASAVLMNQAVLH